MRVESYLFCMLSLNYR